MFFQKKYINQKIEKEIKEKGFTVYNYVTLKELFLTVQRDYLEILSQINLPFGIITIILGVIGYISESFILFFFFVFGVYIIIFLYLAFKLILRAYYFLKISDVVYTENGIILGDELHKYSDETKLIKKLEELEEMFEEFLSKPSKIEKVIESKKRKNLDSNLELAGETLKYIGDLGEDGAKLAIPVMISHFAYVALLYFFYYFGYFFGIIIFFIINIVLKIILFFNKNIEFKIKNIIESIDESFLNMKKIEKIISRKINTFKDGEISDISSIIEKNFSNFYIEVLSIMKQKKELNKLITNSRFKNFVNFKKLENYLKDNFNKPILEMTSMLEKFEKLLEKQIELLRITKSNSQVMDSNLDKKEILLKHKLDILKSNKNKLEKIIM